MKVLDGTESYRFITCALARTQSNIISFFVGNTHAYSPGIPPSVLDIRGYSTFPNPKSANLVSTFSKLERCAVRLASCIESSDEDPTDSKLFEIAGLPITLGSMEQLTHLKLRLPNDLAEFNVLYTISEVMPRDKTWFALEISDAGQHLCFCYRTIPCHRTSNAKPQTPRLRRQYEPP